MSQASSSGVPGAIRRSVVPRRAAGGNRQVDFALAGYADPAAQPGASADPRVAADALMRMFRVARYFTRFAPNGEQAEEALSRTFADLAGSSLTELYRPSPAGVKPYVDQVIRRHAADVMREFWAARRREPAGGVPFDAPAAQADPAEAAELKDLAARCAELLAEGRPPPGPNGPSTPGSSTVAVRKHRRRKAAWMRVAHLFPDVPFRPRRRRK